ncbi:hypothetical protein DdX_16549 [Ditylenchus destructor]|uniref:Uncharacterized protein n=1 Tax=Ditylenchus destructor TaxID=166010 RepID=A0AAD4QTZ0_9BILA|nr:hypothetical protein DdX_16549 [Ditylenchus destructor]
MTNNVVFDRFVEDMKGVRIKKEEHLPNCSMRTQIHPHQYPEKALGNYLSGYSPEVICSQNSNRSGNYLIRYFKIQKAIIFKRLAFKKFASINKAKSVGHNILKIGFGSEILAFDPDKASLKFDPKGNNCPVKQWQEKIYNNMAIVRLWKGNNGTNWDKCFWMDNGSLGT